MNKSLPLTVIAEHNDFYVIEKPAGLNFHSEEGPGFVVLAEQQLGEKLFAVHRLDKVTSGLIILARSSQTAAEFTRLFTAHEVDKFYLALSDTKPKKKQGWIKGDMAKSRRSSFKLLKTHTNPAITRFYSFSVAANLRGYILKPYSGKTHQLRVALKSIAAPILGDALYGGTESQRTYLHAYALCFTWKNERFKFICKPNSDALYGQLIKHDNFHTWQQPWNLDW
ncbi:MULTISPECIES: TIGR01621 family pseudouridine synthase [unclassified Pseudoalteromonas]|uniref:TIGR01621 family pseudouridine synthase n=1 Tax=unclassified Pseudoalteromonas TaxID=194690 RepID=UPI0025B51E50|nr:MULTISPECIES: TIGR01621 family pseudouridine synthase [unclassified Pseudoalteromonas]MDN3377885.1 TIGR01621 family pseudouridine synthase [Pseudoalteromonas sp. APC 3893]MDN3386080.1 TIGR01621 family pseudouridine synthase [Pseudoalteromonas sp. APC 4017]